ncbi:extracellular solute-binding protein [Paenibacillus cremeus]|uniref:Extracellular solute-binding protein n=1 Tax=Paenibacillus cremeus TaxID=2163881 RepID=A0A559JHS9_9BACL|nr:extracellular solute-binding protein [Paenibacillus cremeus]TVX99434.1 extracellular solute-binding protein [Paenibacillus cremeus]
MANKITMLSVATVLLVSSTLAACSKESSTAGNAGSGTGAGTTAAPAGPVEISIFANQQGAQAVDPSNPVLQEIMKLTNSKLNINWVPFNTINEKTKVMLASGDLAELTYVGNPYDAQVVQMSLAGAFWDITPYIKDYKNLSSMPQIIWDNAKVKGKNYGVPRPRPLDGGWGVQLRKDWMDKLGLKVPETMDDVYNVIKAFTTGDPEGNGKADTIGLVGDVSQETMGSLAWVENVFNGTPGSYKLVNGQLVPVIFEPTERKALEWLKKAYDEKVLVQDFAVLKSTQSREQYMGNKAGMLGSALNPQWLFTDAMRKIDPKADSYPLTYLIGPDGKKFAGKDSGLLGMYVIPKTVPEAKMKQILGFMDKAMNEDVADLANYGLKDKHYTIVDGVKVPTEQAKTDNIPDVSNNLLQIFNRYDKYLRAFYSGIPKEYYERNKKLIDDRTSFSVVDPAYGLISNTALTAGPDLNKKIQDMKVKVIMGKESLAAWDDFVAKMKTDSNFTKITQELNEAQKTK